MPTPAPSQRMWGRFEHSLDDKGRLIVPQKFRDALGKEFVLTIGPGHHIRVYPTPIWEALEEQLIGSELNDELDPNLLFLQRMFGNSEFVAYDPQFRLSIPKHLREWAELSEEEGAIIAGCGTRLEIWSKTNWKNYSAGFTEQKAAAASREKRIGANGNGAGETPPPPPPPPTETNGTNGLTGS